MLLTAATDCEAHTNTPSVRAVICLWSRSGGSGFSLGRHPAPGHRSAAREGSPLHISEVSEGLQTSRRVSTRSGE